MTCIGQDITTDSYTKTFPGVSRADIQHKYISRIVNNYFREQTKPKAQNGMEWNLK